MSIFWMKRARARLKLIYEYINEESPQAAIQAVDRITARSMQLDALPNSGRQVPEYQRDDVERCWKDLIGLSIKSSQVRSIY